MPSVDGCIHSLSTRGLRHSISSQLRVNKDKHPARRAGAGAITNKLPQDPGKLGGMPAAETGHFGRFLPWRPDLRGWRNRTFRPKNGTLPARETGQEQGTFLVVGAETGHDKVWAAKKKSVHTTQRSSGTLF